MPKIGSGRKNGHKTRIVPTPCSRYGANVCVFYQPGRHGLCPADTRLAETRTMIRTVSDRPGRRPISGTKDQATLPPMPLRQLSLRYTQARAVARLCALVVWIPLSVGFEACLLPVPGTAKIRWTRVIWGGLCKILGLRTRGIGQPAEA